MYTTQPGRPYNWTLTPMGYQMEPRRSGRALLLAAAAAITMLVAPVGANAAQPTHTVVVNPLAGTNAPSPSNSTVDHLGQPVLTVPQFLDRYGVHYRGPQPQPTTIDKLVARPNNWVSIQFKGHRAHFQTHGPAAQAMNFRIEWAPGEFVEDHQHHSWKVTWEPSGAFKPFAGYAKGHTQNNWIQLLANAKEWYEPQAIDFDGHTTETRYVIYWSNPSQPPGPDLPAELLRSDWGHGLNNAPADFNERY